AGLSPEIRSTLFGSMPKCLTILSRQMRHATGACTRCRRAARTGAKIGGGEVMDPSEVFSLFSINRLDGEPVPHDLRILLPHRDELAVRGGVQLELGDDWAPRIDAGALAEAARSDPEAVADLRARAEVCRLCAFVARDTAGRYFGYWRGPSHRKITGS